ncbi:MAG: hypothetical protein JO040_09695, partial [Gemmatimonadetes bacterium]|nr:hypothetical protein [Gemmatimonadota bacterium]
YLYDRLEAWVEEEDLLSLERTASSWWFSRWCPPRPMRGGEFAQGVREQEFSLVEWPLASLERTAVECLAEEGELPPRQQHLAEQLRESFVGVWEVRATDDVDTLLASPLDGRTYPVREHAPEVGYRVGAVAMGRLIPFGDGTYLRSPGMLFTGPAEPEFARPLAGVLEKAPQSLPPAAVLEAVVSRVFGQADVPREVKPARNAKEAKELLAELRPLLEEAGMARRITLDELAPEVDRSQLSPDAELYDYELDTVLYEWIQALGEMARGTESGGKRAPKSTKGKTRKKPRRKR